MNKFIIIGRKPVKFEGKYGAYEGFRYWLCSEPISDDAVCDGRMTLDVFDRAGHEIGDVVEVYRYYGKYRIR